MTKSIAPKLVAWYQTHGRHGLPWQRRQSAYRVWISEIMLQQTQVKTVIPYYNAFIKQFPSTKRLATAKIDNVLSHWSGLGYYARARNCHKAAKIIHEKYHGRFPKEIDALADLPGIGRSTAGAIASFAFDIPAVILDGNVKRVLTRYFMIEGWYGKKKVSDQLWDIATQCTPHKHIKDYNQAIMDLGATICSRTQPQCHLCPLTHECAAHIHKKQSQFPTKKPKATTRRKEMLAMIVIRNHNGAILLEKRKNTGIWGGLWSLPEHKSISTLKKIWKQTLQIKNVKYQNLDAIEHQFSHYDLLIKPTLMSINTNNLALDSKKYAWRYIEKPAPGGIPAPITKLLKTLEKLN